MTVLSFTTQARDGDARAPGALERHFKSKHLPVVFATAEQVHGPLVRVVKTISTPKKFPGADGLLTDVPHLPLAIFTADCVPLFLSANEGHVIGILHAGWRGVKGKILAQAVRLAKRTWRIKPSDITVWVGPHIQSCCFEVQWDVARYFTAARKRSGERWTIDLAYELQRQAEALGLHWQSKKPLEDCTMHGSRHFSYRRDKTSKRQASVIMKQ